MKTSFLSPAAALAAMAILGAAQPAFAYDHGRGSGGGNGHAVAAHAVSAGSGAHSFAARSASFRSGGSGNFASVSRARSFSGGNFASASRARSFSSGNFASTRARSFNNTGAFASRGSRSFRTGTPSVAFGGSANRSFAGRGAGRTFAFASHGGWTPGHEYFWRGHHYRYFDNAWFIIDPYPYYYGYYDPGYYDNSDYAYGDSYNGNVSVNVQQALADAGYYNGPIDGVVGPGTRAAIASFQRDNGLPITGTITASLLNTLNQG